MKSYAWVPTATPIAPDIFKVYVSGRNEDNFSQTGYFTFNIVTKEVLEVSTEPVIELGPLGSFDDSLALASSLVIAGNGDQYLYYVGWMQGKRVRYYPSLGLSISKDGGKTFQKVTKAPLIERSNDDPFGMASPFVMLDDDDGIWKMWYASYRRWELRDGEPWPQYQLRYAESNDGINWRTTGIVCIGGDNEEAVARPWVVKENGLYRMWYSVRMQHGKYRIGYAESVDGKDWKRMDDKVGIETSENGWDSEMIEYPCIFDYQGRRYMLYNGNTHGKDGVGLAYLEEE
jgi:hypothetical protein